MVLSERSRELLLQSVSDHIKSLNVSKPDRSLYCSSLEKSELYNLSKWITKEV